MSVLSLNPTLENAPFLSELESTATEVLRSGQYILGPSVAQFEQDVAEYLGAKYAIAVSSGTDALLCSLMALGVGPGDEVITSPFSFFATVGCILRLGARPLFVDIDPTSFNLTAESMKEAISQKTKALLPVHLFGQTTDLSELRGYAKHRDIAIVEDAAQAFGARGDLGFVGRGSGLGCFSFFPSKNLGGFGDGGLIATDNEELNDRLRMLRSHGASPKYHHIHVGGNFRMDTLQAALLSVKLPHLDNFLQKRKAIAQSYLEAGHEGRWHSLELPQQTGPAHTYNQFVVLSKTRNKLHRHLKRHGIQSQIYYPSPLHLQPALKDLAIQRGDFPHAEHACQEALALPIHPAMTQSDIESVIEAVQSHG